MEKNYWDEFEYNKLKLLLHYDKVQSVMDVMNGKKEYDEKFPLSVEIHLTDICNLGCPWCTDKELRKNGATQKKETVFRLIDEFAANGTGVTLEGGGEPTLHPDFKEIVQYAYNKGTDLGLITNGTQDISEVASCFKWIRVSLDSSNAQEYIQEKRVDCFEKVLNNLEKICSNRNPKNTFIGIGYVLTKNNHGDIDTLIRRLDKIGVDYIYFRPVEEAEDILPSRGELYDFKKHIKALTENLRIKCMLTIADRLVEQNGGLPCVAHSMTSIIHANGEVALCEKRRHDLINLGNIQDKNFEEVWNSELRKECTRKLLDCKQQAGCAACRVTSFNDIFDKLEHANTKNFI